MKALSSPARPAFSNWRASSPKRSRSSSLARRAAPRATRRSSSRRTSSSLSCAATSIADTTTPRRGRIVTRRSRASRCKASRIGVRPMPRRSESICSDTALPGSSWSVTISSSISVYARSVKVSALLAFLDEREELVVLLVVDRIAVILVGKLAAPHLGGVLLEAADRDFGQVGIALGELRLEVGEHAQQVVRQENLPVGTGPGADADGGDLELLGNGLRDLRRHRLELEHEAAGVLDRERVLEDLHGCLGGAALDAKPAEHRHRVRRKPDMRSRRDAGVNQRLEDVGLGFPALRLHRVA